MLEISPDRVAQVDQQDAGGHVVVVYADGGRSSVRPPRPFLGGQQSGFHSAPQRGDLVLVHHEWHHHPVGLTSIAAPAPALYPLQPGESVLLHADGRLACLLRNTGDTTVISTPAGAQITVDAAGNIDLHSPGQITMEAPGGVTINGQQVLTYRPV